MFKIPLVVVQIDERQRQGQPHVLQLSLQESNEDDRMNAGDIAISLKIRPEDSDDPTQGFDRKRFKPGDVWYLVKKEEKKPEDRPSEPPQENE